MVRAALGRRSSERHPGSRHDRKQRALVRDQIGTMVGDVLAETRRRVAEAGVETIDDVRARGHGAGRLLRRAGRGGAGAQALPLRPALQFARSWCRCAMEAQRVVANLAAAYRADPRCCPKAGGAMTARPRGCARIGDFIAGMTDRFAIARHEELVGPVELPDRF